MDPLLSVDEVCSRLRISRSTWDKWRAAGRGPVTLRLPNGSLRVRHSDLEAWLEERVGR